MKLPTLMSTEPLKRPPFGFLQTPQKSANLQDHFKPQEPTELRWKWYTQPYSRGIRNFALGFHLGSGPKCFSINLFY